MPAQRAAGGMGRVGTGCQPSMAVLCLRSKQAGALAVTPVGLDSQKTCGVKGWVQTRVAQHIGAVGAVPCAELVSSPLARLGSNCCSGHSAHPSWTLPGSQHTPGWGQHCPCPPLAAASACPWLLCSGCWVPWLVPGGSLPCQTLPLPGPGAVGLAGTCHMEACIAVPQWRSCPLGTPALICPELWREGLRMGIAARAFSTDNYFWEKMPCSDLNADMGL